MGRLGTLPPPGGSAKQPQARRALDGWRRGLVATLVTLGMLTAAACSSTLAPAPSPSPTVPAPEATTDDAPDQAPAAVGATALSEALDHVHGLVVTGDGALLAGTHTGVVAVTTEGAVGLSKR